MSPVNYILVIGQGLENLARYFLSSTLKISTRYTGHVMTEIPSPAANIDSQHLVWYQIDRGYLVTSVNYLEVDTMDKSEMAAVFQRIWCKETSAFPDTWTPDNPAHGQCLSTSRIAKSHLGGNIVLAVVNPDKDLHFYNVLANGAVEDFTSSQLCESAVLCPKRFVSDSELDEWGLIFPEIARRYQLLLMKFQSEVVG